MNALTKTSVLAVAFAVAIPAMAAPAPHTQADSDVLHMGWNFSDLSPGLLTMHGEDWLEITGTQGYGVLGIPGAPDLPVLNQWLGMPDRSGIQIEIVHVEWEEYSGRVIPEQEATHEEYDLPLAWSEDQALYASDNWFPAEPYQLGDPVLLRNQRMAQLCLQPVQTNPVTGMTRILRELEINVSYNGDNPINERTHDLDMHNSGLLKAIAPNIVSPPGDSHLSSMYDGVSMPGNYRVYARNSTVANNSILQNLLNWKREKGHQVDVLTTTELGSWSASSIRADISNAYFNSSTPPDYILLIGDPSESTGSSYYLPCGDSGYDGTQDHYYAMIEGGDILGDVAVGRFSVTSSTQLQTVANKVLAYETTPGVAEADMGWLERAALAVGYDALSMRQQSQTIIDDMIENGVDAGSIATRYGSTSDSQGSWVNSQYNSGIGLYNYRGWIGMNGVNSSFVDNSSNFNNAYRTPVAAVFTCSTGDFNGGYSTTEAFLRKGSFAQPRGAVAAMGFATSSTHTAYNNVVCGGFWGAFLDLGLDQIGPAMFYGKYNLVNNLPPGHQKATEFSQRANLMGDPGMDMWVGVPEILDVELAGGATSIPYGSSALELLVTSNGATIEGVTVCLYQNGVVNVRGLTDSNGRVWLDASGANAGVLKLTASRSRHVPDRDQLTVVNTDGVPEVSALGISGDGLAAAGETVSFYPVVSNNGSGTISNLSLTISVDPAFGTVVDATCSWASIGVGNSLASSDPVQVQLNSTLADASSLVLGATFSTPSRETWEQNLLVPVSAPELIASNITFAPGGSILLPGLSAQLDLDLSNLGGLAASSLSLVLGDGGDPFLTVNNGVYNGFSAASGASATAIFQLTASTSALRGHVATLPLSWSGGGISGSTTVQVSIGSANTSSPTGPDSYGYYAIENADLNTLAPNYDWQEIATPAGGSGTALNLGDNGDEQDAATLVSLPFTFTYYGQNYTQMAVCSNGFVAFEPGAELQHDFRNHYFPTSLGPDAMIGVNWDDHKSSGSNGVYVKYIPADHVYVVEWYQMQHNQTGGSNTFQVLLYDPAFNPTPTGDGPFKMQYATWNNTQSSSTDFEYCSVGIKDQNSAVGMTLTNFNIDAATVEGFQAGRAILFTTEVGSFDDTDTQAPVVIVNQPGVVEPDLPGTISAQLQDQSGILSADLYWSTNGVTFTPVAMSFVSGDTWSGTVPGHPLGTVIWYYIRATDISQNANMGTSSTYTYTVTDGNPPTGPDSYGYRMYDSQDAQESRDYAWVDISSSGTAISLGDDQTTVVSLPFPVVYYGATFSNVSICSNGFIALGNESSSPYTNTSLGQGSGINNQIAPFWDDLNPNNGGSVRYWYDSAGDRFVISWIGVPHFSGGGPETFQVILYNEATHQTVTDDSPFQFQYHTIDTSNGCSVGHQNSGRTDGNQYLYNNSYDSNAAALSNGESIWITTGTFLEVIIPPNPVTDLHISIFGSNVLLQWTLTGANSYRVDSDVDAFGGFATQEGTTALNFMVLTLPAANTFYRVTAVNDDAARSQSQSEPLPVRIIAEYNTSK